MRRYQAEEHHRWEGFEHRPGDLVISTRSKAGTTWAQVVVALLVFQDPELPAPLAELSPWLDWSLQPLDEVVGRLEAQQHRRFIKTHTPLAGLPLDDRVTYLVVGRHPLDVAVSYFHHLRNLDRERVGALRGLPAAPAPPDEPVVDWLARWIDADPPLHEELDTLPGNVHHAADAWARRDEHDVVLLHYADLQADLEGTMRGLAAHLGIAVAEDRWPALVAAARFDAMADRAAHLVPDGIGVIRDPAAFFRAGRSGAGTAMLADHPEHLARYQQRLVELVAREGAPPELGAWLSR